MSISMTTGMNWPEGTSASFMVVLIQSLISPVLVTAGLVPLFLVFLKIGSVLFGSGYVLLAFLRSELVERYRFVDVALKVVGVESQVVIEYQFH